MGIRDQCVYVREKVRVRREERKESGGQYNIGGEIGCSEVLLLVIIKILSDVSAEIIE